MSEEQPAPELNRSTEPITTISPIPLSEEELEFIAQREAEQQQWNELYEAEEAHRLEHAAHRRQQAEQARQKEERELDEWHNRNAERRQREEREREEWRNR